jgi:hypothetical protein
MCDVLLPPGVNPTAVKYIYIYIISYICSRDSVILDYTMETVMTMMMMMIIIYDVIKKHMQFNTLTPNDL